MPRYGNGLGASNYIARRRLRELHNQEKLKVQTVPGGSAWNCSSCERLQPSGFIIVRMGGEIYCKSCAQEGKAPS